MNKGHAERPALASAEGGYRPGGGPRALKKQEGKGQALILGKKRKKQRRRRKERA